ncbi:SLC13 family permease [Mycolicibacterium litorale]|uniref:SLC13 family permease n=1 Tax=Mycolicibacterium litorale TaxID=758802 RepID=A0AAD1IMR5_9MYCO|nr:SLC13 family permease [Mycolicibacterium litorale]MCV7416569.1 anion permease [Mycolicibacterium litorale]TDY09822.1 citrate transporter [Mycolicibacterium litorale]BBY17781.1 SLC13 family permease [Mycolicibacterium litorale]
MSDATLSLVIVGVAVALFIWNRLPVEVVAIGVALVLFFTGLVDTRTLFSGFGDAVIVFIASLFVVSEGLGASGVTAWVSDRLARLAGQGYARLLVTVLTIGAVVSAVITVNGAAAALVPVTVAVARRARIRPSKVLIPLAFGCSAGALLTLGGSPVNVLIFEASRDRGEGGFGYFEFALIGVPLVLVTIAVAVVFGNRLLPDRESTTLPSDFSDYLPRIVEHWGLDRRLFRLTVGEGSAALDVPVRDLVAGRDGVTLVATETRAGRVADDGHRLAPADVLVVEGDDDAVAAFAGQAGCSVDDVAGRSYDKLVGRESGLAELAVPPRSDRLGEKVFPGHTWDGLTVLSVHRMNADVGTRVVELAQGDAILVHGRWSAIDRLTGSGMLVVDTTEDVRRQTVALDHSALRALAVLAMMVGLLISGAMPPAVAALLAALATVALRVVRTEQVYRAIPWQTIILIGALIPLSTAIQTSGAAELIAAPIVELAGNRSPYLVLTVVFVLTALLGQFISNVATVLVVVPIAVAAATESGISVQAMLMLVALAGAASLLTPIATPANMIVLNPGGYRFSDYWRLGIVTMMAWYVVAMLVVPLFWPLR